MRNRLRGRIRWVLVAATLILGLATVAYAAEIPSFSDIAGHWAEDSIERMAAMEVVQGRADGTFGPDEPVTRAQVVTFLDRYDQQKMAPAEFLARGCPACHMGPYTLKAESVMRGGEADHAQLPDDAGLVECLECHAPGTGERADMGNVAPLSLRDIVHPAHLNSKIFTMELMGNCFSCHNVNGEGEFEVLSQPVAIDDHGIPDTVPIPGALPASRPE